MNKFDIVLEEVKKMRNEILEELETVEDKDLKHFLMGENSSYEQTITLLYKLKVLHKEEGDNHE